MARLRSFVHVPVGLDWVVYGPDDEVPAEHAALITNPKAWEGGKLPSVKGVKSSEGETVATSAATGEPPRAGKGSSRDAWAEFASERGVHVEDEDSRDDIITALVDAGVIEE
jgi:hypothetical protein